jgi:hypothetical protein
MKKIYLALMCMASLSMMTACGGDKKADKAAEAGGETTEVTNDDEQNAEEQQTEEQEGNEMSDTWGDPTTATPIDLAALYAAGDYKPLPNAIFEDVLDGDVEETGELPTKWDIKEGSAEVGAAQHHGYITGLGGNTVLMPKVAGAEKSFLGEKYSLEFELLFGRDVWYHVNFYDAEDNGIGDYNMWVGHADWNMARSDNDEWIHGEKGELHELINRADWNHFAATYDKGNMKFFVNGKRIANMPSIKQAAYFTITLDGADENTHFITNIRVAK